jgi:hypothetical protein
MNMQIFGLILHNNKSPIARVIDECDFFPITYCKASASLHVVSHFCVALYSMNALISPVNKILVYFRFENL